MDSLATSQIRNSGLSVSGNISEGFGRKHTNDKLKFYYNARGSLAETKNHLIYGHKIGYFNRAEFERYSNLVKEIWWIRKKSKRANGRHSGESRNPVILDSYENTGHRFSPVRRLFTRSSDMEGVKFSNQFFIKEILILTLTSTLTSVCCYGTSCCRIES